MQHMMQVRRFRLDHAQDDLLQPLIFQCKKMGATEVGIDHVTPNGPYLLVVTHVQDATNAIESMIRYTFCQKEPKKNVPSSAT